MSFLNATTSLTRFKIVDPVPSDLWPTIPDKLRQFAFRSIDDLPEENTQGWTAFDDLLDTTFTTNPVEVAEYMVFALRVDTRRIPAAVVNKAYSEAEKEEIKRNMELGKKFISRERKKELKEQVVLRLRQRFLPVPQHMQVVWNTTTNTVYMASTQQKVVELFQKLFTDTFLLHLEPLTPYEMAKGNVSKASSLDTLQPTAFA